MKRENNSSKPNEPQLTDEELNNVAGGDFWDAFMTIFVHGGVDASHTHSRREGGGPRGG
jgi:hypothetical protein